MRACVALTLIGVLLVCPLVCGAGDVDCSTHHESNAPTSSPDAPMHCPDEGGSCVCNGAIRSVEVKSLHCSLGEHEPVSLDFLGSASHSPTRSLSIHSRSHAPCGLSGPADAQRVRALLQNYRC